MKGEGYTSVVGSGSPRRWWYRQCIQKGKLYRAAAPRPRAVTSESVARTDSFSHARLSQACSHTFDSLGIYQSFFRPDRAENDLFIYDTTVVARERARARGLGRACAVAQGGWLNVTQQPSRARGSTSLGSGALALREYACDAMQKWETVHVSAELQIKGARDDSVCK
eukprot:6212757-Pleurochrysis_carterae.AAC.3